MPSYIVLRVLLFTPSVYRPPFPAPDFPFTPTCYTCVCVSYVHWTVSIVRLFTFVIMTKVLFLRWRRGCVPGCCRCYWDGQTHLCDSRCIEVRYQVGSDWHPSLTPFRETMHLAQWEGLHGYSAEHRYCQAGEYPCVAATDMEIQFINSRCKCK